MEAHNHFTCIAYDSIDFLIQSKYVVFGIFLDVQKDVRNIVFNRETLPHIHIGSLLEKEFLCSSIEDCNVVLVMKMQDFAADVREEIVNYTNTAFPASGNIAISVNTAISSKSVNTESLHLLPQGIRERMNDSGISAIGFSAAKKGNVLKKQILLSPDNLLKKFFSMGLLNAK